MAKRLTVIFQAVDNISSRLSEMASIGNDVITEFHNIEAAANQAFARAESGASAAEAAIDRTSDSANSLSEAMEDCSREADLASQSSEQFANAGDMAANELEEIVSVSNEAADGLSGLGASADEVGRRAERLGSEADELGDQIGRCADEARESQGEMERFGGGISTLSTLLASGGMVIALKEIGQAFYDCALQGEVFETSIAKLQTISGGDAIEQLKGEIMSLSNDTGQAADALADTAYNAISAGTSVGESVNMAATASELAVAGFTDTSSALSVLTTAINSYGDAAGSAEHISDSLVTVQNLGVTTVAELSQQMGKAISTASAYNVSLENLESGYISVTKAGINAAEGTTYLSSMFNELGNTGSEVSKLIQDETGKSFGQLMEDGRSVADVLGIVYESCNQNAEAMMNMWGSAEAGKAANAIISQGMDTFNENLKTLETSVGVTADAYAVMADTTEYAHSRMDNAAKNLQATIGGQLNPTLGKLYDAGADVLAGMNDFIEKDPLIVKTTTALGVGLGVVVAGITAVSIATKVELIPAIVSFGTALNAAMGPIGWTIMAISGITAAGAAFALMMSDAEGETAGMTASTREQYYELQDLNSEYERSCEEYGRLDEKTLEVKYNVDALSASFDANRQTLEEFSAEVDALCESVSQMSKSFHENIGSIQNEEAGTMALIQKYKELAVQTKLTDVQQKELEAVTGKLAEKYPDLADGFADAKEGAEGYAEAMRLACEQEAEARMQAQAQETYIEAMQKGEELEKEIAEAQKELALEQQRVEDMDFWENVLNDGDVDVYKEKVKELNAAQEENEALIAQMLSQWQGLAETEEEAASEAVSYEEAVQHAIGGVKSEVSELAAAYDEAYESAFRSIGGQYNLWDSVESIAETSIGDLNAALDSQTQYWENYAANLDTLIGKAGQIEGLGALLKNMDDGSEESASALSAMANASDEQLEKMVEKYQSLQEAQSKTADGMVDLEVDFSTKLNEMSLQMEQAVDDMNMEEKAAAAARNTLQSYIDSIRNMTPLVKNAIDTAAKAAADAFGTSYTGTPSKQVIPVKGHALGTVNSENAYIAGEDGPELILSKHGGDTVFPSSETDRIISAVSGMNGNPQITSGTPSDTVNGSPVVNESTGSCERVLNIRLEGSGSVAIGSGISAEGLWDSVKNNFKQAFMSMLQEEMYEEGAGAYEF